MYQVLALDLDGTVLTDKHRIHPEVKKAIKEAKQYCHVLLVTGRHHTAARPYYQELELDTAIICCNGTYVYDYQSGSVLTHNAIDKEHAQRFIALAQAHRLKMVMYITDAMTYSSDNPVSYMLTLEAWAAQCPERIRPNIYRVDSFSQTAENTECVWKFVVEGEPQAVDDLMEIPWIQANFNGERSWSNRIDFAAKGNSKGWRLANYVKSLGFQPDQVMAVGDHHNDISMLQYAGLGVAMGNADETVKSNAQILCKTDNNHDGLALLIREHIKG